MYRANSLSRITSFLRALLFIIALPVLLPAQHDIVADTVEAGAFDMGKMWTFDFPPKEHFKATYGFEPDDKWFENARLASLRFASYCSASFVSPNGLVMTNHHCARESGTSSQKPGENFNETGFYAKKQGDERKVEGLFVDQLIKILDVTERIQNAMAKGGSDQEQMQIRRKEYDNITNEYKDKEGWKDLTLQIVRFYNGGKYSLYGFKRYNDVRLVFVPELQLGFFGGDYDNFTYPRYNLDCSFFRVYDEKGQPLKTDHYFKFNPNGAAEGEPVFVTGNPGSTSRLMTISDLEERRDVEYPIMLSSMRKRSSLLKGINETEKSDNLINSIFEIENSIKAINGIYGGLKDPYLMARKAAFEKKFRNDVRNNPKMSANLSIWDDIAKSNQELKKIYPESAVFILTGGDEAGDNYYIGKALWALAGSRQDPTRSERLKSSISMFFKPESMEERKKPLFNKVEEGSLTQFLEKAQSLLGDSDPFVKKALNGKSPKEAAQWLLAHTRMLDDTFVTELLQKDSAGLSAVDDPMLQLTQIAQDRSNVGLVSYRKTMTALSISRSKLGRMLFDLYGTKVPPDATFSLRINDGVVKGYEYNGTLAPAYTTFYGMYDRYYGFRGNKIWSLPERWQNPPAELLKAPMNFVTTNDIIGGNSGSPMINKNLEVVGLVFDGNMESLPGDFIYVADENRTVAVHAGGIYAALKYIYKAKRLLNELAP